MRIRVVDTSGEVAVAGAAVLSELVSHDRAAVVGWPTGKTAVPLYDQLTRLREERKLDLGGVRGFNLDELVLPPGDPQSFAAFMQRHAWGRTGLDPSRCDVPSTQGDLAAECRRYDTAIEAAGGLELAILGLGADGHVAYNLPGPPIPNTHVVVVPDAVASELDITEEHRPLRALTIGTAPIQNAKRVLVMATGERKRRAVQVMVEGPSDPAWPCSLLREHPNLDLVIDRAAAGEQER